MLPLQVGLTTASGSVRERERQDLSTQLLHPTAPPRHHSDHAKRDAHRIGALAHHHPGWCVTRVGPGRTPTVHPCLVRQGGRGWLYLTRTKKDGDRSVPQFSHISSFPHFFSLFSLFSFSPFSSLFSPFLPFSPLFCSTLVEAGLLVHPVTCPPGRKKLRCEFGPPKLVVPNVPPSSPFLGLFWNFSPPFYSTLVEAGLLVHPVTCPPGGQKLRCEFGPPKLVVRVSEVAGSGSFDLQCYTSPLQVETSFQIFSAAYTFSRHGGCGCQSSKNGLHYSWLIVTCRHCGAPRSHLSTFLSGRTVVLDADSAGDRNGAMQ